MSDVPAYTLQHLSAMGEPLGAAEPVDIEGFIADNEFDDQDIAEIRALRPGAEIRYGGGAAAISVLRHADAQAEE